MVHALQIVGGLALLVVGGEAMVRGAVSVAVARGLSPAVIGATVVAAGTSLPELLVSLQAAWRGSAALALGNVVGSNIYNVLLVLGLTACIAPCPVDPAMKRWDGLWLVGASAALLAMCWDGSLSRAEGALLLAALVLFLVGSVRRGRIDGPEEQRPATGWRSWAMLAGGLAGLSVGADLLVSGATDLAAAAGVSERVVGLTVVAIGTSLPELFASVVAALRGQPGMAVANVVGSNIFNILGILGCSSVLVALPVEGRILSSDMPWMVGVAVLMAALLLAPRVGRLLGIGLLGGAVAYSAKLALHASM